MSEPSAKHTPEPWKVRKVLGDDNALFISNPINSANGGWPIATPHGPDAPANSRLIVAAPDLLRELKSLVDCFWDGRPKINVKRDFHLMVAIEAAKKAIRKAEGGE